VKSDQKKKTLTYRRAVYFGERRYLLEASLKEAHKKRPDISQRNFSFSEELKIECRNFRITDNGIFLHLTSYTPGERASTLKRLAGVPSGDVDTTLPPDGFEFMDGDIMVYVVGNNVLLCATNLHEKKAEKYMIEIIEAAGLDSEAAKFSLSKVGDINKLELLNRQGAKAIHLNANLFDASFEHIERKTILAKLFGRLGDEIKALISTELKGIDIEKAENLTAHLLLRYDKRHKHIASERNTIEKMANRVITEDDDDNFMIETLGGEKIKKSEITVKKSIILPKLGKSVHRSDAWRALEEYFNELQSAGILEQ
jgi:hypothetical protein